MPEETIDPGLLEQTKNQIRKLVAEIADLAESDIQPPEFYVEFLNRAVAAVAASGGAFWLLDGKGSIKLQHQLEFRLTGLLDGRVRTQPHDALLGCMIQASQPQIIPPGATIEGQPNAGNPTPFTLIIAPLMVDRQVVGLIEILMDPTRRAATQKSTLRFVSDLCDLAGNYLKNRQMRQMMSQQRLWNQLEGFTHQIHGSLDLKETAYAIANDGKRLVGCDRFSVAAKIGGRVMVEAVSGQEVVEQRANLIRELTRLCKVVIRSGEDLIYTGNTDGFAPDIRDALELYVDESGSKAVIVTLLHKPETDQSKEKVPFGCLVAEQIGDEMAPTDAHARTEVVSRHASTALWNAQEHDKIFLLPMLKLMGSPWRFFRGRTLAKIIGVLVAVVGLIAVLTFVPWKLTIEGRGSLLPEERRITYAPTSGIVVEVPVEHSQVVHKGDLLVRLESKELERRLKELMAEKQKAESDVLFLGHQAQKAVTAPDAEKYQIQAQRSAATITAKSAQEQIESINEQLEEMKVRSPQDGIVTSWEVRKNLLGRPVEIGQELIAVASTVGDWVLEVEVPDDDMGPVLDAQSRLEEEIKQGKKPVGSRLQAYFVTATDPEHRYPGYVLRVGSKAELVETKHVVKVTVGFTREVQKDFLSRNQALRPGAEVRARIDCGKARLAYVMLRDVVHVFYETVLFRWPFLR
ncbi:efflux RND transporter periplasmic adaptor subunit [Singulisphaera acidiphila]|uniref:Membrane-fusion protein n=1 Tax=Singulisphaera acidiphila (strain ATCC BAA-1392 / DSM 18658 / VKM B-2454 / MOB10) TaxID=886293 RepID=L0DRB4_SINAD|nr:biotin/lipoyl-binding protein [Singulisphaera acidiphila]AGA30911.1 membrane-fusion protein [Singulisphaera acidiphila DSM 18658]